MKKTVSLFLSLVMVLGLITIPATAETNGVLTKTTLIDMDFESLSDFDVMDEFTTAASGCVYKDGIGAGLTYAATSAETIDTIKAASSVEVVSTNIPGDREGKVLKYFNYAGYNTYNKGRNHVLGQIQPISTLTDADLDLTNSILVTEYDMYIEGAHQPAQSTIASPSAVALASNLTSHNSVIQADANHSTLVVKEIDNKATTGYSKNITGLNKWSKVRIVIDVADNSYRMYIDDVLVQAESGSSVKSDLRIGCERQELASFPTTFYGLAFGGYAKDDNDESKGATYYDNIKVTKIDTNFALSSYDEDVFASFNRDVTGSLAFTTPVDADTVNEIYLASTDGTKVDGGITAAVDTTDATKVNITLGDNVKKGTYKLVIPEKFTDIYGQGIGTYGAEKKEIAVTILKAAEIFIDDVLDGYDSTTRTFSKTLTVNNVATEDLPVWIVAAAYDERNCMIGFAETGEIFTLGAGQKTTKDISLTVEAGKTAKYIRIFVWNGDDTMKPYQAVEEIIVQ